MKLMDFCRRVYDFMVNHNCPDAQVPDMYIIYDPKTNMAKIRDKDPNREFYERNIECCGVKAILSKAVEEMAELQQQLCKTFTDEWNIDHIAEEFADVQIMLEQVKLIMSDRDVGFGVKVSNVKKDKIKRQEERNAKA